MLLYLIRHGDPIYDPDDLTELGYQQAQALAKRFAVHGLDHIYASTSNRAIQTATPTAQLLGKEITQLDWCHESLAFNDFSLLNKDGKRVWGHACLEATQIFASREMADLGGKWHTHPIFEGTNFHSGIRRIQKHTEALLSRHGYEYEEETGLYRAVNPTGERIALFAHHGFGQAFLSCLLNIPYPMVCTRFGINHSGVTVIEFREGREIIAPIMLTLSSDAHLYKEDLPTKYCNRIPL